MGGGGSSTRRVTFEADENENITVVKGVRLSNNVIDRMKEPSSPSGRPQSQNRSASGAVNDEELKKRIAEELALERARRDSEAQKRRSCEKQIQKKYFGKAKVISYIKLEDLLFLAIFLAQGKKSYFVSQKIEKFYNKDLSMTLRLSVKTGFAEADDSIFKKGFGKLYGQMNDQLLKSRLKQEQTYVRDEFGKLLERERIASNEHLTRAVLRERAATEEERQKAQHFAKQLEEKDRELKKHDAYYKEQLARLEERSAQFYKVTTEQYQKAADEVSARFKRYESHPVCADLQGKILQCYQQHAQETLSCSALASQYLHCVNHAKQSMLGRGG